MDKSSRGIASHYESIDTRDDLPSSTDDLSSHDEPQHDSVEHESAAVREFIQAHGLSQHLGLFNKAHTLMQAETHSHQIPGITDDEVQALQAETEKRWQQPKTLYFTILVCSLGAVEQGWAQTSMNGANLYFPRAFGIDTGSSHDALVIGLINSGIYFSTGFVGAWSAEPVNNLLGRRGAIFIGTCICLISNLGSSLSQTWPILLAFRLTLGIGLGLNASTVSVLAAESAPSSIRGGLAVSWQMFTAFGIFLGFVANVVVYDYGSKAWRLQLGAAIIPTIPLLLMVYSCPESPSWHIKNDARYDRAFASLCRLRNTNLQAARDLYAIYLQQSASSPTSPETKANFPQKVMMLATVPRIRRAAVASYVVMLSQQLCGINIIAFYSSTIFSDSGFTTYNALLASCIFGLINFLGAFPAIWTMDTLGRRSLLLYTLPPMAITMSIAGLASLIPVDDSAHFILLATSIYLFCAEYSPGMGPVPNAYSAEVFPLSHREIGMSMAVSTANFWAAVLSFSFPKLLSSLGTAGSFELYAVLNVVALALVFLFVPETKCKTLEELDGVFGRRTRGFVRGKVGVWVPRRWKGYGFGRGKGEEGDAGARGRGRGYREVRQDDGEEDT